MIRIAIVTTTRAEYGLMRQLLFAMQRDSEIDMNLIVSGTHLSPTFGMTVHEILEDGIAIKDQIDILSEKEGKVDVAKTFSNAISKFSDHFEHNHYDYLLIDGDRYEIFAAAISAVISGIPVIHCAGGATTEGANDEYWRHAITKISSIHFPTMEIYRQRIIQMGEDPERVFVVGSLGLENIRCMKFSPIEEIEKKVGLVLNVPFALVTFHPVTLENHTAKEQINELLAACEEGKDMKFIFTKSNADADGDIINKELERYVSKYSDRMACVSSLGAQLYLSAMSHCIFVMGNSSSGLIEAPSFKIPTINIGDRQKGREQATSILNCVAQKEEILCAIRKARSETFRHQCEQTVNPNGDGYTCAKIISRIKEIYGSGIDIRRKSFYDIKLAK